MIGCETVLLLLLAFPFLKKMGDHLPLLRGTCWGPIAAALVLQMASQLLWQLERLLWVTRIYHAIWLEKHQPLNK